MRYQTHITSSVAAGAGLAYFMSTPFTVAYVVGITIGSVLPDIDEPNSFIGRRSFGIAHVIKKMFGHRGITHSLVFWLMLTMYCALNPTLFMVGISVGYLFHIIGDSFSMRGMPLLLPFTGKRSKFPLRYKTAGKAEQVILNLSLMVCVYFLLVGGLYRELLISSFDLLSELFSWLLRQL